MKRAIASLVLLVATAHADPKGGQQPIKPMDRVAPRVNDFKGTPVQLQTPPAGPAPSSITGLIQLTDPTTNRQHVSLYWDESRQQWAYPKVRGLVFVFRPVAGGADVRLAFDKFSGTLRAKRGASTVSAVNADPFVRTDQLESVQWRVYLRQTPSAQTPGQGSEIATINFDPAKHSFVGVDASAVYLHANCDQYGNNCKIVVPVTPRGAVWPAQLHTAAEQRR